MSHRTLILEIDREDLRDLQERGYNLCFSRDLYDREYHKGNVVLSAIEARLLSATNQFSWVTNKFQIFETVVFEPGAKVRVETNIADIQEGMIARILRNGDIIIAAPAQPGQPITVINEWRPAGRIGFNCIRPGSETYGCFDVSPPLPLPATMAVIPGQTFSVFWDMDLVANTMFDPRTVPAFSFDLSDKDKITLRYEDGDWSVVG